MIPSEAPLLHHQVKLVDPVDRQAQGPLVQVLLTLEFTQVLGIPIYQ